MRLPVTPPFVVSRDPRGAGDVTTWHRPHSFDFSDAAAQDRRPFCGPSEKAFFAETYVRIVRERRSDQTITIVSIEAHIFFLAIYAVIVILAYLYMTFLQPSVLSQAAPKRGIRS